MAEERGDLDAAGQAFAQNLTISQRLAQLDPDDTGWQQGLATTWNQIGDVAQDRRGLAAAEHAYTQALAIFQQLTELDPANAAGDGNWPKRAAGPVTERETVLSSPQPGRTRR